MLISSLKIKNYRGLDINIDTIEKVSIKKKRETERRIK